MFAFGNLQFTACDGATTTDAGDNANPRARYIIIATRESLAHGKNNFSDSRTARTDVTRRVAAAAAAAAVAAPAAPAAPAAVHSSNLAVNYSDGD